MNARDWLFGVLILAATGLFAYSWFQPWWGLDVEQLRPDTVLVRPWGEELYLGQWAASFDLPTMPSFFTPLMWAYFGICMILLLVSIFLTNRNLGGTRLSMQQAILGLVGLSYIVAVGVAAAMISMNLQSFEVDGVTVPLQGTVILDFGDPWVSSATSSLRSGYWLALGAGLLLVVLALLRGPIVGRR